MDNGYNKYMMLKVRSVSKGDFGSYKCVAKNSLGETDGLIKLDGEYKCVWPRTHSGRQDGLIKLDVCVAKNSLGETDGLIKLDVEYKCVAKNSLGETDGFIKLDEIPAPSTTSTFTATAVTTPISSRKKGRSDPRGQALFSPGSALFSPGSALFSPGSALFSPGQRYRKQWKPRLEGGNKSRDYEVEGWRDSGEVEGWRDSGEVELWGDSGEMEGWGDSGEMEVWGDSGEMEGWGNSGEMEVWGDSGEMEVWGDLISLRRLYAAIPGSTSRDTKLRPPTEGPLVPTLLFVLPAAILGQLILLVLTPSAMALLYSHPRDCNAAAYKVLYGLERGGKGTPVRRIKLEVGRSAFKSR
uniref:Immunoglobulin I-set domain-containing protein n=1 Tax=Timema bartmani TaxID=61472 RepID=A0A7R9F8I3_9NEOP|nr:unnamed protein product [Timema bartmani]